MKKVICFIIGFAIAIGAIFGVRFWEKLTITNEKHWKEFGNSEISVTIPKTMKEGKGLDSSQGTEAVALYGNTKASVSVNKLSYSSNPELKDIDIDLLIGMLSMGGQKLTATPISNGYYATYTEDLKSSNGDTKTCYSIEAFFSGDDALYSIKVTCFLEDRSEFEPSMLKWVESFKIK